MVADRTADRNKLIAEKQMVRYIFCLSRRAPITALAAGIDISLAILAKSNASFNPLRPVYIALLSRSAISALCVS